MRSFACFLLVAACASAALAAMKIPWTSLIATWRVGGITSHLAGTAFYDLPLTAAKAAKEGWVQARAETYTTLWCMPKDPRVCLHYDLQGSIAGVQASFLQDDMAVAPYNWTAHAMIIPDTILGIDVGSGRYFFVSQDVLASGGRSTFEEIGDGLWLQSGNEFVNVPLQQSELPALGWTEEGCIPSMGRQYYQNITSTIDCQALDPYLLVTDDQKGWVRGIGFQAFGKKSKTKRDWLETVPAVAVKPMVPNSPECLTDWAAEYGLICVHVYFHKNPYFSVC